MGVKALGVAEEDFLGGEGTLDPSLVTTCGGHACLGGYMVVAMWLMDFGNRLGLCLLP